MKRGLLLATMFIGMSFSGYSQESDVFSFNFVEDKLDDSSVNMAAVGSHYMGSDIAVKLELLKDSYTWKEEGTPNSPTTKTVVEKPAIYYSLKKLDKYYKKAIKKGDVTEEAARDEFVKALDIALFIRYQETAAFEDKLRELKEESDIALLYTKKVKLEF
ncbi:MAG: hypothetical protein RIE86_20975 [Imperialibacter sp.]|uniref:hypothetical protein n=1 Tax=Imperialibacter sp. TaxID=2038411 RepID=UPI0032ED5DFF